MVRWLIPHATVALHAIVLTIAIALTSQLTDGPTFLRLSFNRLGLGRRVMSADPPVQIPQAQDPSLDEPES